MATELFTPSGTRIPPFDELPKFKNFTGCAWDVWGKDDQLGTVGMLTPEVVARAAKEEIRTGRSVCLNWPLNFPAKPMFGRIPPQIILKSRPGGSSRDDEIHFNTQSGTQWDGLRHYGVVEHGVIYNNTPISDIKQGLNPVNDPSNVDQETIKMGIHKWAQHGISGRGVFLDVVKYFTEDGSPLPYNPWTSHGISPELLKAVAKKQGVEFRPWDILLMRMGFMVKWETAPKEEKEFILASEANHTFAGLEQSEDTKRFLWDNHFAAVLSDQPSLEQWPSVDGEEKLHQTILGLWGMPIGELFDLEALSRECTESGRYTFFFSSWPLNILGGCASPGNAGAYF